MTEDPGISHSELIATIPPVSEAFCSAHRVKIAKQTITYSDKHNQTSLSFQRGVAHTGRCDLTITVHENVAIKAKCSLGHEHETGKTERKWGSIQISWEMAEALNEWFQTGDYKKVRDASKRERDEFKRFQEKTGKV